MDVLRRNTDYALRCMIHLATGYGQDALSTRILAEEEEISYQLACKLMQRLHKAGLVESTMGPRGGFRLKKKPSQISLMEIITVIQGPFSLNRCLVEPNECKRKEHCKVTVRLDELQGHIESYLCGITLDELVGE